MVLIPHAPIPHVFETRMKAKGGKGNLNETTFYAHCARTYSVENTNMSRCYKGLCTQGFPDEHCMRAY